jgi:hypothetical protein
MRSIGGMTLAAALTTAACMPVEQEAAVPVRGDTGFTCNAAPVQRMVGQIGTRELGTEAVRLSNARTMRWIGPDAIVTMEYRQDRLNIHHDARNRITRIVCG